MRNLLLAVIAAAALSGCVSILDDAYDDQARNECDHHARSSQRSDCYDRVDSDSRERRRHN